MLLSLSSHCYVSVKQSSLETDLFLSLTFTVSLETDCVPASYLGLFTKISFFRWYTLVRCKRPGTGLFIESFVNLNMKTIIFRTADYLVRYGAPAEFEKCYELLS